ncbi:MAG TPA: class I SAM-dependent methyltransferase [Nitrosomonas europaea]|uniref:class I SAM-dependent methyltransferase n=1 Tax=Betaproteobacteria TaxID=28216 RepID=UPI002C6B2F3D|nr:MULTISPECIES: class I SAM-dependent methyltransferase [Betaproteobacteria]HRN82796.1 class I SAM-dependent methyltransferase [Nitrosomonas europaea]HRO22601.1 class I SAM-dependent methyltransferase [Alcaligenes phenolicus]HUM74981.1 class I SAM-dependent methyltransferase [Nitrosomonas europaea]
MDNELDGHIEAYGERFDFAFDNQVMLNWYPERIMRLCPPERHLLELGIGHGYTTNRFSRYFARHVVIDGSASVIGQFRQQYPDCLASIVQGYFEGFETDERFDVTVMGFVLEHVANPREVLERYKKFMVPGGRCFVAVPNGESLHRRIGHAAGLLRDMMSLGQGDLALGHVRTYSVQTLSQELEAAGYQVVRKEGIFLKPLTTAQLQSLDLSQKIISGMCEVAIDYPELSAALLFEAKVDP